MLGYDERRRHVLWGDMAWGDALAMRSGLAIPLFHDTDDMRMDRHCFLFFSHDDDGRDNRGRDDEDDVDVEDTERGDERHTGEESGERTSSLSALFSGAG